MYVYERSKKTMNWDILRKKLLKRYIFRKRKITVTWNRWSKSVLTQHVCISHVFSHIQIFVSLQPLLSMGFPSQENQSGLPFLPPRDLSDSEFELSLLHCRWILYLLRHQGSPSFSLLIDKSGLNGIQSISFKLKHGFFLSQFFGKQHKHWILKSDSFGFT